MSKTIMVSDQAYALLTSLKGSGESYSQIILKYLESKENKKESSILDCAGSLSKTLSKEDWQKFEDGVKDARKLKVKSVSL